MDKHSCNTLVDMGHNRFETDWQRLICFQFSQLLYFLDVLQTAPVCLHGQPAVTSRVLLFHPRASHGT